jgi:hypothetical protein
MNKEQVTRYLGNITYIHNGGCLVSAFSFYLHEKKAGRADDLQIVQFGYDELHDKNYAFIAGEKKRAAAGSHFGWTYDGGETCFDCYGVEIQDTSLVVPKHLTEKFCLSALNYGGWNWSFDRTYWVPKIAKKLGVDLSKVYVEKGQDTSGGWGSGGKFRKTKQLTNSRNWVQL